MRLPRAWTDADGAAAETSEANAVFSVDAVGYRLSKDEATGPEPKLVPLDELKQRRVARLPRPVDPATDLHAQPRAGGRDQVAGRPAGEELPAAHGTSSTGTPLPRLT
jgi:hypothetical protein